MGNKLERLLKHFLLENKEYLFNSQEDLEIHLQNLLDFENRTGKKIHLIAYEEQQKSIWQHFKIQYKNTIKFDSLNITIDDREDMVFFENRNQVFDRL